MGLAPLHSTLVLFRIISEINFSTEERIRKMKAASALCGLVMSLLLTGETYSAIIQLGDLNIIDASGNASDGLRYLDLIYSSNLTGEAALANARLAYANARLATPDEFDDLFSAAGIVYDGALSPSDGFTTGGDFVLSSGANYDGGALGEILFQTRSRDTSMIWTAPDSSSDVGTTRDFIRLIEDEVVVQQSGNLPPTRLTTGWLIVSEASVPEPSRALLSLFGFAAVALRRFRR